MSSRAFLGLARGVRRYRRQRGRGAVGGRRPRQRPWLAVALVIAVLVMPLGIAAPAAAAPTQISGFTAAVSATVAGSAATYTLDFTTSATGALGGSSGGAISLTFSPGLTVSAATYSVIAAGSPVAVSGAAGTQGSSTTLDLDLAASAAIGASTAVEVALQNVINPPAAGAETITVSTTANTMPASATMDITTAASVQNLTLSLGSNLMAATTTYTLPFIPQHGLSRGQSIGVEAPPGTDFSKATASIGTSASTTYFYPSMGVFHFSAGAGSSTDNTLVLTLPTGYGYAAGHAMTLQINGVVNPTAVSIGVTLQLWTSTDRDAATTAPYDIVSVTLQTSGLPAGSVAVAYNGSVTAAGGTAPYTFSWSGAPPPGLSLGKQSGAVTGTPTAAGTYDFTIGVTDSSRPPQQQSAAAAVGISPAGVPACPVGTSSYSGGIYGAAYSAATGLGVAAVAVGAAPNPYYLGGMSLPSGSTNSAGCFEFTAMNSAYVVSADAAAHATANVSATVTGDAWVQANLPLFGQAGACPAPSSGQNAYGLVSDVHGKGIVGATVSFGSNLSGVTDASGCYQIDDSSLIAGNFYGVALLGTASAPGSASSKVEVLANTAGQTLLNFMLATSGAGLTVTPPSVQVDRGSTTQLTANYSPGNSVPATAVPATWQSQDPTVATVSTTGLVAGVAGGQSTVVTATYAGVSGQATVDVIAPALTGLTVSPDTMSLAVGALRQLAATAHYADGSTATVTSQALWSSSDMNVANVSPAGVVAGTGPGRATITAALGGLQGPASVTVSPGTPASASINAGNNQAAVLGQTFATPLAVQVVDAADDPLSGIPVTFTAPASGSGAAATFPGGATSATVPTDGTGIATAPTLLAAGTYGAFTVIASVAGLSSPPRFTLTDASSILQDCSGDALAAAVSNAGLVLIACSQPIRVTQPMAIQSGQTVTIDGSWAPGGPGEILGWIQTQVPVTTCGSTLASPLNTWQGGVFYVCAGGTLNLQHLTLSGGASGGETPVILAPDGASGPKGTLGVDGASAAQFGGMGSGGSGGNPGGNGLPGMAVQGGLIYVAAKAAVAITDSTLQDAKIEAGAGGAGGAGGSGGSGGTGGSWCQYEWVQVSTNTYERYAYDCVANGKAGGQGGTGAAGGGAGTGGGGGTAEGGAIYNAGSLVVTNTTFMGDQALGGASGTGGSGGGGGSGGVGGNGAYGPTPDRSSCFSITSGQGGAGGSPGGSAGNGKTGGKAGSPGTGMGGAIYNASGASLAISGGSFDQNRAAGGAAGNGGYGGRAGGGGWGGWGGDGANTSYPCYPPSGGKGAGGGDAASGGGGGAVPAGGAGQGGAIYNAGTLTITGATFGTAALGHVSNGSNGNVAEGAAGATGGSGGAGYGAGLGGGGGWGGRSTEKDGTPTYGPNGFPGQNGCDGSGGGAANGGNGGNGQGGAIYSTAAFTMSNVSFMGSDGIDHNAALGGLGGPPGKPGRPASSASSGSGCGEAGGSSVPLGGFTPATSAAQAQPGLSGAGSGPDVFSPGIKLQVATQMLPPAVLGEPYSATLNAVGGTAPYAWQAVSGAPLPSWLALGSFGTLNVTGTPLEPGTYTFGVEVTDATAPTAGTATATLSIVVVQPLSVTPTSLGGAPAGQSYTGTLTVAGGVAPYTWTETGLLPLGLSFSSQAHTATISGTPWQTGAADFTVEVADSSTPPQTVTIPFVFIVTPPGVGVTGASSGSSGTGDTTAVAGGTGTPTPDITATATGGTGRVNVAQYSSDPGDTATFAAQGDGYFDVTVTKGSTFTNLSIMVCNLPPGFGGIWWDGSQGWVFTSAQFAAVGCDFLYISATSIPPISALSGSVFALGGLPPAPVVTGLAPAQGPAAGGTIVVLHGANLSDTTVVDFGQTPTRELLVLSPSEVDVVAPPGSGTVGVSAVTPAGVSPIAPAAQFTYTAATAYVPPGVSGPAPPAAGVGPAGGVLATPDGTFTATLPPGAVPQGGMVWVGEDTGTLPALPPGLILISPVFALTGSLDATAQTATLQYSASLLGSLSPDRVAVYVRDIAGSWQWVPAALDLQAGTVRVRISGQETLAVLAATRGFSDTPAAHSAAADIGALLAAGAVVGYPDGTFRPDRPVTRAEFVKMLDLVVGLRPGVAQPTSFSDVPAAAWYAPYVAAAANASMVAGTSVTTFSPAEPVTREQVAVLVARAVHLKGGGALTFADAASVDAWALRAVQAAVAAGLVHGFPDGTFRPHGALTRAQAARVLALVLHRLAP